MRDRQSDMRNHSVQFLNFLFEFGHQPRLSCHQGSGLFPCNLNHTEEGIVRTLLIIAFILWLVALSLWFANMIQSI